MEYRQRAGSGQQVKKKPVFPSTEQRHASPHRGGRYAERHLEEASSTTIADVMPLLRTQHDTVGEEDWRGGEEDEADDGVSPRRGAIVRRYNRIPTADGYIETRGHRDLHVHYVDAPPMLARASRTHTTEPAPQQEQISARSYYRPVRFHWLFFVGIVFLVMVLGYVGFNAFGAWWQIHQNDTTYGRPRTFQIDAVVGHNDSAAHPSHFLALNLNHHIVLIEIPGGDVARSIIYSGPTLLGDGQDLTPVTLTFADVNGDGRLDMLVHIADQTMVFLNNGTKFVPPSTSVTERGSASPPPLGGEQ
jgi:hypothetical protein